MPGKEHHQKLPERPLYHQLPSDRVREARERTEQLAAAAALLARVRRQQAPNGNQAAQAQVPQNQPPRHQPFPTNLNQVAGMQNGGNQLQQQAQQQVQNHQQLPTQEGYDLGIVAAQDGQAADAKLDNFLASVKKK